MPTKIEWADATWSPITGCSKISEGCAHCYAERMAHRLAGRYGYPRAPNQFRPTFHADKMTQPDVWKKPRRIFVCSMADIFHPAVEPLWIAIILRVIERNPRHTFMLLTKRPEVLVEHLKNSMIAQFFDKPTPNLWMGVTAENQDRADERIPILLRIPAVVRFVSVEPMLAPIDLTFVGEKLTRALLPLNAPAPHLDWVICGGETGPGARPMYTDWVRSLRDQCVAADVPFFFKKWGSWHADSVDGDGIIDGKEWRQFPAIRGEK
jgi:protein gp37